MKKKNFTQYLGYVLFAVAAFMLIGMFNNTAKISRTSKYFEKDVFKEYKYYDQPDSKYLDGYVTAGNGFYDKDPIYTYKQHDPLVSDFEFTLNIYRARFTKTSYTLYYFSKDESSDAFIVEFKDLKYKGNDLMNLNVTYKEHAEKNLASMFEVHLRFNPTDLPHIKTDADKAYAYTLNPLYPAVIDKGLLEYEKDKLAELIEIAVVHVDKDQNDKVVKTPLFAFNSDGNKMWGDTPIYLHDLDLSYEAYSIGNEVKGNFPTEAEVQVLNLSYTVRDLSPYNGAVVITTIVIIVIVIVAAYLMFFNKIVMAKIHEKRAEKKLAAKQVASMEPEVHQEADFTETTNKAEVLDAEVEESKDKNNIQ